MTEFETFKVRFDTNEIITMSEKNTPIKTKVEPRIMHVLQILIKQSPNVVLRDQLIDEVWNNYGGADDALNQAISHLRKTLHDTDKDNRIIETVIKKGYRFSSNLQDKSQLKNKPIFVKKRNIGLLIFVTIVLAGAVYIYFASKENKAPFVPVSQEETIKESSASAPKSD
jgi:DNA-binding winged helix-turn-helix (wHTH) protein